MEKKMVLILIALLLVPAMALAEQCALYKGKGASTTYDLLTYAGLENAPERIDAYASTPLYTIVFAGDTVYAYDKSTNEWDSGKISDYFPVSRVDAAMYSGKDVGTIVSGRYYYYVTGPLWEGKGAERLGHSWKGPVELKRVAMNYWKPRLLSGQAESVAPYPVAPQLAAAFKDHSGVEQLFIADNAPVNGVRGIRQWWTAGPRANVWFYGFMPYRGIGGDIVNMSSIDAIEQIGNVWLIFGEGDCMPNVRSDETVIDVLEHVIEVPYEKIPAVVKNSNDKYCEQDTDCKSMNGCFAGCWNAHFKPIIKSGSICPTMKGPASCACVENTCMAGKPGDITDDPGTITPGVELPACEVQFTDAGFHGTNKTVTVKVQGKAATISKAISGYYNFGTSDPETCDVSGNTAYCPCTQNTNDIRYVSATLKTETVNGIIYAVDAAGNKVCRAERDPKYGVATYTFLAEDGLKRCNPEQVMADRVTVNTVNAKFHKLVANYVLQGIDLTNIGTEAATVRDISVLYPEVLIKPTEVNMKCSDGSEKYCSFRQPAVTATPMPMVEQYALTAKVMADPAQAYEIPTGKVRPLEVAWDPNAQVAGMLHDISVVIDFIDGSSLAVPIPDVMAEGCTDSDGGRDLFEKGYATGKNPARPTETISGEDYCITSSNKPNTAVMEYTCNGEYLESNAIACPTSSTGWCSNGKCTEK
ncbi:MAG: hypothetical protein ABH854_03505 [Candidatus Diapherotrites archaeon]